MPYLVHFERSTTVYIGRGIFYLVYRTRRVKQNIGDKGQNQNRNKKGKHIKMLTLLQTMRKSIR